MKPTVFNYQEHERVVEENKKLKAEVANLQIRCRIAESNNDRDCKNCKHQKPDGCSRWECEYEPAKSDLISRQDAIEAVATVTMSIHLSNVLCDKLLALPSADRPTVDKEYLIDLIQEAVYDGEACAKLIDLVDRPTGWIPVSERLPENNGCMLVTIDDAIEFGKYEDGEWSIWVCEHWDEWDAKGVIAWMPLPEPYKGGEDE